MRLLALLLPFWLALTMGEHSVVHQCPTHSATTAAPTPHEHAGHHEAGAPQQDSGHGDHACMCIGACTTASSIAVLGASCDVLPATVVATADVAPPDVRDAGLASSQLRIPFANAPPVPTNVA
ncbi:MAG: hypothetical protein ACREOK_06420 [Gemmatimonadaceae bacterium]